MTFALVAGCAPPGSNSATVHSCSPNYIDENKRGRLAIQQRHAGATVAWGTYPKLPARLYIVRVYVGRKVVDGKNQNYPPHGSIPPEFYRSGQIFKVVGKSYDSKHNVVQTFYIKCRLA